MRLSPLLLLILWIGAFPPPFARAAEEAPPDDSPPGLVARLLAPTGQLAEDVVPFSSVVLSPDGSTACLAAADGRVLVYGMPHGKARQVLQCGAAAIHGLAVSPDGKHLALARDGNSLELRAAADGKVIRTFDGHTDAVKGVDFSPDGTRLVSSGDDTIIRLWDVASGKLIHAFEGHQAGSDSVAFGADGRTILSEAGDVTARLWDAGRLAPRKILNERDGAVAALALSPDGRLGVTTRGDFSWHLFDVHTGADTLVLRGWKANGSAVGFHPDGRSLITGDLAGEVYAWDLWSGQMLRHVATMPSPIEALAVDPNGRFVLVVDRLGTAVVWDLAGPPALGDPLDPSVIGDFGDAKAQARAWEALGARAYEDRVRAIQWLLAAGEKVVPLLVDHVKAQTPRLGEDLRRALDALNADKLLARERAMRDLRLMLVTDRMILEEQRRVHPSAEVRARLAQLLHDEPPMDAIRFRLGLEVLGWLVPTSPAAGAHLEKLAAGTRVHPLTWQAQGVLESLAKAKP